MCHMIRSDENLFYGFTKRKELVGVKTVTLRQTEEGWEIIPPYQGGGPYLYAKTQEGIVIEDRPIEQTVEFVIPLLTTPNSIVIDAPFGVKAGLHLMPLVEIRRGYETPVGGLTSMNHNRYEAEDGSYRIGVSLLALTHITDVIFFDGTDVSVRRFVIPSPERYERVAAEILPSVELLIEGAGFTLGQRQGMAKRFKRALGWWKEVYEQL